MRWLPLLLLGCAPEIPAAPGQVEAPRILAIRADPPEVAPGARVTLTALAVSPDGPSAAPLEWALCTRPVDVAASTPVSLACLAADASWILPIDTSARWVEATVPLDACAAFGSTPPPPPPGGRPRRPVDPDPSGGYHQPVRATQSGGEVGFGRIRLRCPLAGAPAEAARAWRDRYVENTNPEVRLDPVEGPVAPGTTVDLRARWGDDTNEAYVVYDRGEVALAARVEALTLSWFTTAGALSRHRGAEAGNAWTAPDAPGPAFVWVVLRDDRGGVGWAALVIDVSAP